MTTYGTSAYLKLISLSQRASTTEIRKRLAPSEGGYDFHKRLRSIAGQFLTERITLDGALIEANNITKSSERESARAALSELSNWRRNNPGEIAEGSAVVFSHESGLFSVKFSPDFLLDNGTNRIAFHIWNTLRPPLSEREALGALTLFADHVSQIRNEPNDIAVLYLRRQTTYRLSQASDEHVRIGYQSAQQIATIMHSVQEDLRDRDTVGRDRPIFPPSPRP